jgi:hypothetical protein
MARASIVPPSTILTTALFTRSSNPAELIERARGVFLCSGGRSWHPSARIAVRAQVGSIPVPHHGDDVAVDMAVTAAAERLRSRLLADVSAK